MTKKYKDYTAEEKAAYNAKRDAYWKKREEDTAAALQLLKEELLKLNAGPKVWDAYNAVVNNGKGKGNKRAGYLTELFGTEEPEAGTVSSMLYIGVRGPNGERLNANETLAQFVNRVKDISYKYDANSVTSMVWYCRKRGHDINVNKEAGTVTYVGFEASDV